MSAKHHSPAVEATHELTRSPAHPATHPPDPGTSNIPPDDGGPPDAGRPADTDARDPADRLVRPDHFPQRAPRSVAGRRDLPDRDVLQPAR
ncbi:hypothetical protein FHR81_003263 [Actinoalloteichus hoggarensis]|uniref:Uncharacterized protein n=1 Tax=Actinoalloteichus hoggarensis TaxID=1470176 RepID=A0A221W7W8_9PSEU|nr:hypothetical protein AHOG_20005 [Actinoalloteichus hoggarensis]MBB5922211.1 hypothetical protein [Actinoalloteichus hoggarensis]